MQVSIIIVNYNTLKMTCECINSIFAKTQGIEFEVILIDNASKDGSKEFFERDDRIKYIYNEENLGFGKANNIGIKHAQGEYLFLLNSDTLFLNNVLLFFLEQEQKLGGNSVLGTWLLNADHKVTHSYGRFPCIKSELNIALRVYFDRLPLYKGISRFSEIQSTSNMPVDYIVGADLFVPRCVIERTGDFDENFFMYYEETDLQRRMSKIGINRVLIPGPQIVHLEGKSQNKKHIANKKNLKKSILTTTSMLLYLKKYSSSLSYNLFKIMYFVLRFFPVLLMHYEWKTKLKYYKLFL